jgi:beta-glucosidase
LKTASGDSTYGQVNWLPANAQNGAAHPVNPAGGAPGGNPRLWDVMFTVTATVTNTGTVAGDEVPQLYLSLGGPNDPVRVLRDFDRIHIKPGQSATFKAQITRRDISNWSTAEQNWFISNYPKMVYVGNSSRNLPLSAALPMANINGVVAGAAATATYANEAPAAAAATA